MEWRFNSMCDQPGIGDNSRDLTRRTEERTIRMVMGVITQGKVTEKINCANPKDNHGITFTVF